ncbi:MAG: hypothetical protein ACOH18_05245 [Candidatus Saccharimonadaceae bacterium]
MRIERDLLKDYSEVVVPKPMHSIDAIDERVSRITDAFFKDIRTSLYLEYRSLGYLFEIDYQMLVPSYPIDTPYEEMVRATNDYLQTLKRRGGQTLAAVLYTRTDFNQQIVHFSKFPLLPETVEDIRAFQLLERIELGEE